MTTEQKVIKNKVGLLTLAQTLGNVSQACKVMGFSRDSFYRFKVSLRQNGVGTGFVMADAILPKEDVRWSPRDVRVENSPGPSANNQAPAIRHVRSAPFI
jgi:hypothetical protein